MKINKNTILLTSIPIILVLLSGCYSVYEEEPEKIEVREYKGKDLSSIQDFRENSIKGPQYVDLKDYKLEISGLVKNTLEYNYDEVIDNKKYSKVVTLKCVEGWDATILWEGLLIKDLLKKVDILPSANTIIFHAYDGYTTSFPLDYVLDNDIILAYKMNNLTLLPERGFPFQLVAESKWGYKWIKWVTKIELSDDPDYKGFWEGNGYSNSGNLNESFIG